MDINNHILSVQNLHIEFTTDDENVIAVENLNFTVSENEILAIVGESGSGKSVTSLAIMGLLAKNAILSGAIHFQKKDNSTINLLANKDAWKNIRGNEIAMIFQEPMTSLNPLITCGKQVAEAIQLHSKVDFKSAKEKTIELFNKVKLPNPTVIFDRYPHEISGGQKQRVMIAMALCANPKLLIADEPTTALDVTVQKSILLLLKEIQNEFKIGIIFITHDLGVVKEIANNILVMYKGNQIEYNNAESIFNNSTEKYTNALLATRPSQQPKGQRLPTVEDILSNIPINKEIITYNIDTQKVLIKVENLSVKYPTNKNIFGKVTEYYHAINNINFEVFKGEILGVVGESGCGKTTLGRSILQLIKASNGKILLNGKNLCELNSKQIFAERKAIQIVFQDPYGSLNPRQSIGNAILETMQVHKLFKNNELRKQRVFELLEKVNLSKEHYNRYPHEFSGGQRQRICIARALALEPSFLIFDESVSALDVSVQAQVLNLITDLKKEFNFTAIFISHDLSVVHYIADRIMVMKKGEIVEIGFASDVYNNPQHEYTQQLIKSIPGNVKV